MELIIKTMLDEKIYVLVDVHDTIMMIKNKIKEKASLTVEQQVLIFGTTVLIIEKKIRDYNMKYRDMLLLTIKLRGS